MVFQYLESTLHTLVVGPATTQKVYQGILNGFPAGGATMIDSFQYVGLVGLVLRKALAIVDYI